MFLEHRTVSRKTPADGRLEITAVTAAPLLATGAPLGVLVGAARGRARVTTMSCTCGNADRQHLHYFLESELLKALTPEHEVALSVDDDGLVQVEASPGR